MSKSLVFLRERSFTYYSLIKLMSEFPTLCTVYTVIQLEQEAAMFSLEVEQTTVLYSV